MKSLRGGRSGWIIKREAPFNLNAGASDFPTKFGDLRDAVTPKYPEDSVQYYCSPWWIRTDNSQVKRGRLLWAFVPHVDQHPFVLIAEGRTEATEHGSANYRFEP